MTRAGYLMVAVITRVVIATGPGQGTSFLGFYSYFYSSGAYPARLEQLLISDGVVGSP